MFYRVAEGDRQRAGTGLGLAICKGLIEAMGGTIRAETPSPDGIGTRIVLTLPVFNPESSRMTEPTRILVIEDEAPIRRFLRVPLEAEGHSVIEAGTAREGIARHGARSAGAGDPRPRPAGCRRP